MKRMIDVEKFLDKLLYMGYMDEEKSEVEEVANKMTEDAYTKDDVITMFKEIMLEIEEYSKRQYSMDECISETGIDIIIQDKIDGLRGW